jgi:hypothetical protein
VRRSRCNCGVCVVLSLIDLFVCLARAQPAAIPLPAGQTSHIMQVTVPLGLGPGQAMMIGTPGGQMQVAVPPGALPGQVFQVSVPMATAAPMAVVTAAPVSATEATAVSAVEVAAVHVNGIQP